MMLRKLCGIISPKCIANVTLEQVRFRNTNTTKHFNPKYKRERKEKVIKVHLPDFAQLRADKNLSPEEMRSKLKEQGLAPPRQWNERPIHISSTGGIFEEYVPPEGDGKRSMVSMEGTKQRFERLEKKGKSMMAVRKIRSFDEEFNLKVFAATAQDMYIEVHNALTDVKNNDDRLHELVSETCYPELVYGLEAKTLRWNFIESVEPPIAVHVRQTDMLTKENIYAQITVRMHTKQMMALYDRFGRLMLGSDVVPKDVLEYCVFEKHLSNLYGTWRLHGKIRPDWAKNEQGFEKTFIRN